MKHSLPFVYLLILLEFNGCASYNQSAPKRSEETTSYTSSFPNKNVSKQLRHIQRSVKRITSTATYQTYFFGDKNVTLQNIRESNIKNIASRTSSINQSKAGTAISILQNRNHTALVTAKHILYFPDTLYSYKKGKNIPQQTYIESIGILTKQESHLFTSKKIFKIETIASEFSTDLSLVKIDHASRPLETPPIDLEIGTAHNLAVGSFLYILGFPLSSPMVTRGIVSAPNFDTRGSFLTDALFNHGISGGMIIASRDEFNTFEWVGLALTASASEQQFLIPDPAKKELYNDFEPYTDTSYVSERRLINYGVTKATPIEQVTGFLLRNEGTLNKIGFSVAHLGD